MPPEDPDPKLSDVARALQTTNSPRSQKLEMCPVSTASTVA